jgi:uncharacterized protein YjcR
MISRETIESWMKEYGWDMEDVLRRAFDDGYDRSLYGTPYDKYEIPEVQQEYEQGYRDGLEQMKNIKVEKCNCGGSYVVCCKDST